jgi:hypothetical protein
MYRHEEMGHVINDLFASPVHMGCPNGGMDSATLYHIKSGSSHVEHHAGQDKTTTSRIISTHVGIGRSDLCIESVERICHDWLDKRSVDSL